MNQDNEPISGRMPTFSRALFQVLILAGALSLLPVTGQADQPFKKLDPVPKGLPDPPRQTLEKKRGNLVTRLKDIKKQGNWFNTKSGCTSGVEKGSPKASDCRSKLNELLSKKAAYNRDAKRFNATVAAAKKRAEAAEQEKAVAAFFAVTAAAVEKAKKAARKEPPRPSITSAPLTPGSASPNQLSGRELDVEEYEARKSDVFRRLIEQTRLRDECRERSAACSTDGKAYDEREAIRRRDRQYFLWGEASYYIRFNDLLKDPPPEMAHEIGSLGGIKAWPYGWLLGDKFYFFVKEITNYGSTRPGGEGYAKQGLQKALNDNQGLNP